MTDYAWVPPDVLDDFYEHEFRVLGARPNTVCSAVPHHSVEEFLDALDTTPGVARPIGDLIITTHSDGENFILERFGKDQKWETSYEELYALKRTHPSALLIPVGLRKTPPGKLRLVACRTGRTPEILSILKREMDFKVQVVGCLYFYQAQYLEEHGGVVTFRYSFHADSPEELTTRADLVSLFKKRAHDLPDEFSLIDGTRVTDAQLEAWVPTQSDMNKKHVDYLKKPIPLGRTIGKFGELKRGIVSTHARRNFDCRLLNTQPAGVDSDTLILKLPDQGEGMWSPTTEFPMYRQLGSRDIDECIKGFSWTFTKAGRHTLCAGVRHRYTLRVPVKFPEAGKTWDEQRLLFHFYPQAGSGLPLVTTDFTDDDSRIFVTR
jgi:hypothetical protein